MVRIEEVAKGVMSRYRKHELQAILHNSDNANQVIVSDFDGTIHKGLWERKLGGISNADLAILTTFYLPLAQVPGYVARNMKFFLYEKKKRPSNIEDISQFQEMLILRYYNEVIKGTPKKPIEKAASLLPELSYPTSKRCLIELRKHSSKAVIISKTIDIILEPYCRWFQKRGAGVSHRGNTLIFDNKKLKGVIGEVTRIEDKKRVSAEEIHGFERAIILGDTYQDVGMFEAAEDLGIDCLKVAIQPKQEELVKRSDVVVYSWGDFYELAKNLNKGCI
ncbi:MAG: hypothetical protein ABIB71_09720 [Candidatus Woesearchaeota archaeon]